MREISCPGALEKVTASYQTLRELVSRSLRAAILSGAAGPGQTLREQDLARRLGVSKTPVREALRELEREGLVVSAPHRGAVVVGLPLDGVRELVELRTALEPFAARLAAERIPNTQVAALRQLLETVREAIAAGDPSAGAQVAGRFHRKIYELSGNARLQRMLESLLEYAETARGAGCGAAGTGPNHEDHLAVGEAIIRGDWAAAEAGMRRHMERARDRFRADHMTAAPTEECRVTGPAS